MGTRGLRAKTTRHIIRNDATLMAIRRRSPKFSTYLIIICTLPTLARDTILS